GFFLVGIHAPLTHVMPKHKISDTPTGRHKAQQISTEMSFQNVFPHYKRTSPVALSRLRTIRLPLS
ncbi:hypothetical protein, partial [Pseudomonas syringae]|uniref:hypothetical protein n=1 Tax=Pseudomonas syringae TaxID=317 RepID=UPI001E4E9F57